LTSTSHLPNTCKLCLKDVSEVGPLQQSHIIPRFILKKSKDKNGRALTFSVPNKKFAMSQEDWKERMLCKSCEHLMNVGYENVINETLFLRRKKPAIYDGPDRLLLSADSNHLALALLSIFWRATISNYPAFTRVLVPPYVTDELRLWIYTKRIPSTWHQLITIKVQELKDKNHNKTQLLVTPFDRSSSEKKQFDFVFICGGFCMTFSLPPLPNQLFSKTKTLRPQSRIVRIEKIWYETVPELKIMVDIMLAEKRPGGICSNRNTPSNE